MTNFLNFSRWFITLLSSFTMAMLPVSEGLAKSRIPASIKVGSPDYDLIVFLKKSGLDSNRKVTAKEFFEMSKDRLPESFHASFAKMIEENPGMLMPKVQYSRVKDSSGVEHAQLFFQSGKESVTALIGEDYVKIGKSKIKAENLESLDSLMGKLALDDADIARSMNKGKAKSLKDVTFKISDKRYQKLSDQEFAEMLLKARLVYDAAKAVLKNDNPKQVSQLEDLKLWIRIFANIEQAEAAEKKSKAAKKDESEDAGGTEKKDERPSINRAFRSDADPCIVAGYLTTYNKPGEGHLSCGGVQTGRIDLAGEQNKSVKDFPGASLDCKGGTPCNPMVYGLDGGNKVFCVPSSQLQRATPHCDGLSPLRKGPEENADIEKIVGSWLKLKGLDPKLKDGKASKAQYEAVKFYLDSLQGIVGVTIGICGRNGKPPAGKQYPKGLEDQKEACETLQKRAISLKDYVKDPEPAKVVAAAAGGGFNWKAAGLVLLGAGVIACAFLCFGGGTHAPPPIQTICGGPGQPACAPLPTCGPAPGQVPCPVTPPASEAGPTSGTQTPAAPGTIRGARAVK